MEVSTASESTYIVREGKRHTARYSGLKMSSCQRSVIRSIIFLETLWYREDKMFS